MIFSGKVWSAVLVAALLCAGSVFAADERVLRLDNGHDKPAQLSVAQLLAQHKQLTLTVDDIEYHSTHRYQGIALRELLRRAGFARGAQLMLVCVDGYSIPFDSAVLEDEHWQGLLALQDLQAPAGKYFVDFQHGKELVNFAPFYLVWAANTTVPQAGAVTAADLPWPYQLTEIRVQRPADYKGAMPAPAASPLVHAGFDLYFKHCIKCHSVNGSGGTLSMPLDVEHGLPALIKRGDLRERIVQISKFVPRSKMPDFRTTLDTNAVDALVAYLGSL